MQRNSDQEDDSTESECTAAPQEPDEPPSDKEIAKHVTQVDCDRLETPQKGGVAAESMRHTHAGHNTRSRPPDIEIIDEPLVGDDDGIDPRVKALEAKENYQFV